MLIEPWTNSCLIDRFIFILPTEFGFPPIAY